MKRIYKYPLQFQDRQIVPLPTGAAILTVQVQQGEICLWALVEPSLPQQARVVQIYGTGHPADDAGVYVGTVQIRPACLACL